jgi:hypothetical protein
MYENQFMHPDDDSEKELDQSLFGRWPFTEACKKVEAERCGVNLWSQRDGALSVALALGWHLRASCTGPQP